MSVTLINENTGNFDNVIFTHEHYIKSTWVLYQLCRFVFTYSNWENKSSIKKTKLYIQNQSVINACIDYENQIEHIKKHLVGTVCTQEQIKGNIPINAKKVPQELKYGPLDPYVTRYEPHPIRVMDGDEEDEEYAKNEIIRLYKKFMGHEPKSVSIPSKNENGFYECSTSGNRCVHINSDKIISWANNCTWSSNLQITSTQKKYARIYVAYDSQDDPSKYTWILRKVELKDCPEVKEAWKKIGDK